MKKMRSTFAVLVFLSIFTWGSIGMAAGYPEKPIQMIIPKSAGGGDDVLAGFSSLPLKKSWVRRS